MGWAPEALDRRREGTPRREIAREADAPRPAAAAPAACHRRSALVSVSDDSAGQTARRSWSRQGTALPHKHDDGPGSAGHGDVVSGRRPPRVAGLGLVRLLP